MSIFLVGLSFSLALAVSLVFSSSNSLVMDSLNVVTSLHYYNVMLFKLKQTFKLLIHGFPAGFVIAVKKFPHHVFQLWMVFTNPANRV